MEIAVVMKAVPITVLEVQPLNFNIMLGNF